MIGLERWKGFKVLRFRANMSRASTSSTGPAFGEEPHRYSEPVDPADTLPARRITIDLTAGMALHLAPLGSTTIITLAPIKATVCPYIPKRHPKSSTLLHLRIKPKK
jgi:hypothetical protein